MVAVLLATFSFILVPSFQAFAINNNLAFDMDNEEFFPYDNTGMENIPGWDWGGDIGDIDAGPGGGEWTVNSDWDLIITGEYDITMLSSEDSKRNIFVEEDWVLNLLSAAVVSGNITVNWWKLITDWANSVTGKITLNNAKSIEIWVSSSITSITGTVDNLTVDPASSIENLHLIVSGDTDIAVAINIEHINLRTENLDISTATNISEWVVYVYGDFNGDVAGNFEWKLTVFQNFSNSVASKFEWNLCVLDKISIWVASNIVTYNKSGLFGNIFPIVTFDLSDDDIDTVESMSSSFESDFQDAMSQINSYNNQIAGVDKDDDDADEQKASLKSKKESFKSNFIDDINGAFGEIKEYIDEDSRSQDLFDKIENTYELAIQYESTGQLFQICNNSEISWDATSMFVQNGKIKFDGLDVIMKRFTVLPSATIAKVNKLAGNLEMEKLAKVNSRIDAILPKFAKWNSEKNVNMLLDIKDILRDVMLYEDLEDLEDL